METTILNLREARKRLHRLGYTLRHNMHSAVHGRYFQYQTSPSHGHGGGPTNYFDTLGDLSKYILQVEMIRQIQQSN